ncbi:hypothetical protein Tco_0363246 [Tanacetum coccineum]
MYLMNSVINCLIAKSTWDDLILYHEGPSDVKEKNINNVKDYELASLFGKLIYEENLIDNIYETEKNKSLSLQPLSMFLLLPLIFPRLSDSPDDDEEHEVVMNEEEVSSDDNEMVEVKVLMALAEENDVISKEGARNGEWVKISMEKGQKDLVFVKSSSDDTKVTIPGVKRPWLSEAEGFILPNHDTGRILPAESQRNTTDPSVAVTDSSATDYDSADESSVCNTPLPPLKKLDGAEPISGPKTIKSILRSIHDLKLNFKKLVIINEPSSAPAKGNKSSLTSKVLSAPAGKLKSVKIEDDPPLAIIMKELNNLKLQVSKNQSSYSRSNQSQQFDEKRGIIFNSNKEVVMIAPRVRDVYVLDMTSSAQESCFFAKASEDLKQTGFAIKDLLN